MDMTNSSFPTTDYVMLTYILTCLSDVLDALKNLYLTSSRTLYFNWFLYVIKLFCFSEPCFIRVETNLSHRNRQSFTVTRNLIP